MKFVDVKKDNASIAKQDARGRINLALDKRNREIVESCVQEGMKIDMIVRITNLPQAQILQIIEERKQVIN